MQNGQPQQNQNQTQPGPSNQNQPQAQAQNQTQNTDAQSATNSNGAGGGGEMNLAGVLHYLQSEWRRWERDRNEWEIERAEMRVGVAINMERWY
jgi:striatin 1/3/4